MSKDAMCVANEEDRNLVLFPELIVMVEYFSYLMNDSA